AGGLVVLVLHHAGFGKLGQLLRPGKSGALTLGKERRLLPRRNKKHALQAVAILEGLSAVHVHAIGAAIDLGGAELDQMQQALFETASLDRLIESSHGGDDFRRGLIEIETRLHSLSPFFYLHMKRISP